MTALEIRDLSFDEIDLVSGAVDGVQVAEGLSIVAGAVIAVATLPVTAPVAVTVIVFAAASVMGGAGGYITGRGLAEPSGSTQKKKC